MDRCGASRALAVIATGLLVGIWVGRARRLIIPRMLLRPLVVAVVVRGLPDLDDLQSSYSLRAGNLRPDLSALELDEDVPTRAEFGGGSS